MNSSYTIRRTKAAERWIQSDPLRRKWYGAACPECGGHFLSFVMYGVTSQVKRVECMIDLGGCGWEESE